MGAAARAGVGAWVEAEAGGGIRGGGPGVGAGARAGPILCTGVLLPYGPGPAKESHVAVVTVES